MWRNGLDIYRMTFNEYSYHLEYVFVIFDNIYTRYFEQKKNIVVGWEGIKKELCTS